MVMDERLKIEENFDLLLEIFCHTFEFFDIENSTSKSDLKKSYSLIYVDIKTKFIKYINKILRGECMVRDKEEERHKICLKAIRSFFLLFNTKARAKKLKVNSINRNREKNYLYLQRV